MSTSVYEAPPPVLTLLAHDVRWQLLRALALSDYRVQELVNLIGRPLNLVSYHLRQLRSHQLVTERRSSADARDVYYHLDLERLHTLYLASGEALHPAVTDGHTQQRPHRDVVSGPPARILFLCTHNSARSQMAEGIARSLGGSRVEAFSAGSEPTTVHPDAIATLEEMGIDISQHVPKHLDQFCEQSFDYIITVCDRVRESCPVFPNDPERVHWSFPDPTAIDNERDRARQFQAIARELVTRINFLLVFIDRKRAGR
jgi:ArsR family transcriptional regulator, arsenate/arsenite/antimonite-responsive transcriptional repressor / arsenate reductase (thioredoxin)